MNFKERSIYCEKSKIKDEKENFQRPEEFCLPLAKPLGGGQTLLNHYIIYAVKRKQQFGQDKEGLAR